MKRIIIYCYSFVMLFFGSSCGGQSLKKTPLDNLIKEMINVPTYSIILYDMDVEGTFFNTYKQKYQIIKTVNGKPEQSITPWYEVSEREFGKYRDAMGMTIVSKTDGKLRREIAPAGYSNYVGNPQYGHWVNRGGSSFWEFYGKFAFMSTMFDLATNPIRRSYYTDYRRNYYGRGRAYYGPVVNGRRYYGTYSRYNQRRASNSTWARRSNGFKNRVNTRTSRSSRSSSRYSGSSSRSRGGGFGK
ncbi:MAG: hypothetical protein MI784_03295 [Cytophagales bacterium]|nr:hypothetical protein [Cytophagales bacterium]